jgi:hypothetical protein
VSGRPLFVDPLDGSQRVPGGCDACEAYQTVTRDSGGVYVLTVHHDDGCPVWRAVGREGRN